MQWFFRSPACLAAHPALSVRPIDHFAYGIRLIFSTYPLASIAMPKRQLGYVLAFQSLRPHRAPASDQLSAADVAREPLFYSSRVMVEGSPLVGGNALALAQAGLSTVGAIFAASEAQLPSPLHHAFHVARAAIPVPWQDAMRGAFALQPGSLQDGCMRWGRHVSQPSIVFSMSRVHGTIVWHAYELGFGSQMHALQYVPVVNRSEIAEVHVLSWSPRCASATAQVVPVADPEQPRPQYFLVSHDGLPFSPHLWSFGQRLLPEYVVREGCARRVVASQMTLDSAYRPNVPVRPRIWEDDWSSAGVPSLGLRACEARWSGSPGTTSGQSRPFSSVQVEAGRCTHARPLPRRRAFEAVAAPSGLLPLVDADSDPLAGPSLPVAPPWAAVWGRLYDSELDRSHRILAWRILHMAVLCGAYRRHVGMADAPGSACPFPCCAGALQTLSHLFLSCSVATQVWHWALQVWSHVSGGHVPPLAASVLLADDVSVWRPAAAVSVLWTRFRLSVLHALWSEAGRARHGQSASARSVCARIVATNRKLMLRHWFRVDLRLAQLNACPQWLLSRNPAISLAQFQEWWCPSGALCCVHVLAGQRPQLQALWTAHFPVPIPVAPTPAPQHEGLGPHFVVDVLLDADLYPSDIDSYN